MACDLLSLMRPRIADFSVYSVFTCWDGMATYISPLRVEPYNVELNGKGRHPCPISHLSGKALHLSPLSLMLAIDFF